MATSGSLPRIDARTVIFLAIVVAGALGLRSAFSYRIVVTSERVNLQDNDSWYHMRSIDNITRNWPTRPAVDPYVLPGGQAIPVAPMFDFLVSGAALLAGLGDPAQHTIEIVSAWAPAVMGALIPLAVFAAGRRLFDTRAGLMGAALVAIMPGHLLERSRLGYVDHHVLEALLATICFWLLVRALQQTDRRTRLMAAAWAGAGLGAYLLSWASGSFLVAILATWLVVQTSVDALRRAPTPDASEIAFVMGLVALPLVWVFQPRMYQYQFQIASLAGLSAGAIVLEAIRRGLARARWSPAWQPVVLVAVSITGWSLVWFFNRGFAGGFLAEIDRLRPDPTAFTVVEAMPLASFARLPWAQVSPFLVLGTGLPLGALGFLIIGASTIRRPRPDWILLMVWTAFTLMSTLLRNRFGYYLVPMLAIMGGWICAWCLSIATAKGFKRDLIAATIGALAFAPNLWPARNQVRVDAGLSGAWVAALDWLREFTPPPFPDPGFYYETYDRRAPAPHPQYTVMAWWDYGYWIARAGQRVPNANPTQAGAAIAGAYLSETDPGKAAQQLVNSKARYVVLDDQLPFRIVAPPVYLMGKFETIVQWAGRRTTDFYEAMYVKGDRGELLPAMVFYPAYYQAMVNRLFMFHGKAVMPTTASVITFADKLAPNGVRYREIVRMQTFSTYDQASQYLRSLGAGNHRLVGLYPDQPPVPLEALSEYRLAWTSPVNGFFQNRPVIAIFEFFEKPLQRASFP